eukprot:ctg_3980.g614
MEWESGEKREGAPGCCKMPDSGALLIPTSVVQYMGIKKSVGGVGTLFRGLRHRLQPSTLRRPRPSQALTIGRSPLDTYALQGKAQILGDPFLSALTGVSSRIRSRSSDAGVALLFRGRRERSA